MADGNRSAKGKQVVVDDRDEHGPDSPMIGGGGGAEPSHRGQVHQAGYWSVGGVAFVRGAVRHPYDGGYVSYGGAGIPDPVGWNAAGTNGGSGSYGGSNGGASYGGLGGTAGAVGWDGTATSGGDGSYGSSNGGASYGGNDGSRAVDRRGGGYDGVRATGQWPAGNDCGSLSFPSPFTGAGTSGPQHAGPGYWPAGNGGGSAPFPSPFTCAGAGIPGPHHARTGNSWHTGAGHEFNYRGNGGGGATFPSQLDGYMEQLDSFISRSLTSLSIRDRGRGESLLARGRRHLYDLVNHGRHCGRSCSSTPATCRTPLSPGPAVATATRTGGGGWRT
ncbi:glycine-rich cell wall structural protein 1.0-like [Setaria italica]|uniref:glycine-rich cell wall structural protein 1.0-like n=1 Tax=Setaria italica TaxID=4555 RepID=UPI00035103FF|nr:glycine-rich cell wall structural protein 1.0-like [Setaria italica]